jgi:hypothetical protein
MPIGLFTHEVHYQEEIEEEKVGLAIRPNFLKLKKETIPCKEMFKEALIEEFPRKEEQNISIL